MAYPKSVTKEQGLFFVVGHPGATQIDLTENDVLTD